MRGSSDQTAMNNKHIKRFHFSISPPRSIRSGAEGELIHFLPIESLHFKTVVTSLFLLELLPYAAPSSSDHHLPHIFHNNCSMGKCRSDSSSSCESYPPSFPLPPSFSRLPLLFNLITVPLLAFPHHIFLLPRFLPGSK